MVGPSVCLLVGSKFTRSNFSSYYIGATSAVALFRYCYPLHIHLRFRDEPSIVTLALIHRDVRTKGIPSVSCYFPIKSTLSAQKGTLATLQEVPGEDIFYLRQMKL